MRYLLSLFLTLSVVPRAVAQDRPFEFSVSTAPSDDDRRATVYLDTSAGGHAFEGSDTERFEQRFGIQTAIGSRWTLLARVAVSQDGYDTRASQQGELLYNLIHSPAHQGSVGIGVGLRRELNGTNVLLGRLVAGRSFSAWRVDGNALFERPYAVGRDRLDLISSAGVARRLNSSLYAGVEMIGEDLEGFWERNEAEGGARLLMGPSIRFAPPSGHWQVSAAGGPIVYASRNSNTSDAARTVPAASSRDSFGFKTSLSYHF